MTVTGTASIAGLDASTLLGKTWAIPDPIGSTTPNTGNFTTLESTTLIVSNPTTTFVEMISAKQPSLADAQGSYMTLGKANTGYNTAVFQYNHVSVGNILNYISLSTWGGNPLTITGAGDVTVNGNLTVTGTFTPPTATLLTISNPSTTTLELISAKQPSLAAAQASYMTVGKSNTNYNTAVLQFNHVSDANLANTLSLSTWAGNPLTLDGFGNLTGGGYLTFINNSVTTSTIHELTQPNLAPNTPTYLVLGKANDAGGNSLVIEYRNVATNSADNYASLNISGTNGVQLFKGGRFHSPEYFSSAVRPTYAIVLTNDTGDIAPGGTFNLLLDPTSVDGFASNAQGQAMFSITAGVLTNVSGRTLNVYVTQQIIWDGTIGIGERSSYIQTTSAEVYCYGTAVTEYTLVGLALAGVAYLQPCGGSQQFTLANGAGLSWAAFNNIGFPLKVKSTKTVGGSGTQRTRLTVTVLN